MTESNPPRDIPPKIPNKIGGAASKAELSGQKLRYVNPPDMVNPDPATLRDQWRFAIKQYSRWYSQAWGTAILAGVSFFALGWIIKGSNPLPSRQDDSTSPSASDPTNPNADRS